MFTTNKRVFKVACIGAVDFNAQHYASQEFDCVIAVDKGWQTCLEQGIKPDYALGDFDSLGYIPEGVEVLSFPSQKDESDMELAFLHAHRLGAREIFAYGAFSQRLDHTLSNILVLTQFAKRGIRCIGIGHDFALLALSAGEFGQNPACQSISFREFAPEQLTGSFGPYCSVFAIGGKAQTTIQGLAYAVEDFQLPADCSRGLSNQFIGKGASIVVKAGNLAVMFALDALDFVCGSSV